MDEIKSFVVTLVSMLILMTAIELISPDNSMKKYLKFVLGTILIAVMITPIISIVGSNEEDLPKKIDEYISLMENRSSNTDSFYEQDIQEDTFKKNLEDNCNILLKENFENLDFKTSIKCNINMNDITYSISEVKIEMKDKDISTVQKIIIGKDSESKEVSSTNEENIKENEIINYLSQTLNIPKDKINIYKVE